MSISFRSRTTVGNLAWIGLCAVLCLLAGCALPQAREGETRVFTLSVQVPSQPNAQPQRQILVDAPSASALLDSERIVVRAGTDELGVLRNARWNEPLPQLWQRVLIVAMEDDGRVHAGRERSLLAGDERLVGELRAFEYVRAESRVRIHYHAKRVDARQRILTERSFETAAEVRGADAAEIVSAFNAASTRLIGELLVWLGDAP